MRGPLRPRRSTLACLGATALLLAVFAACSSSAGLVAQGGQCELATDCAEGLVCVPQKDGSRKCDGDLSSIEKPAGSGTADAGERPAAEAGLADATPPVDAGSPPTGDASPPPLADAALKDAGAPALDASDGAVPADAATE